MLSKPTAIWETTLSVFFPASKTSASIGSRRVVISPSTPLRTFSRIRLFGGASGPGKTSSSYPFSRSRSNAGLPMSQVANILNFLLAMREFVPRFQLEVFEITLLADHRILDAFIANLEILAGPILDAVQSFIQVLHGISDAEAQVAFSKLSKRRTRQTSHTRLLQQSIRKYFRTQPGLPDIGKGIERARRNATTKAGNFVKALDKAITPSLKLGAHVFHGFLITLQGLQARYLGKGRVAGVGVGHQLGEVPGEIRAHHTIPQTPAGHGIALGKPIQHDGAVLPAIQRHNGEMFSVKDQPAVNFIGKHHGVAVANRRRNVANVLLA